MTRFSESDVHEIVHFLTEALTEAGFTGTKFERGLLPQASWEILTGESRVDKEDVPMPETFSEEIIYHRVTTDQGTFGLWLEPFITLDLGGTGVAKSFLTHEVADNTALADWCFFGLEQNTFKKLFTEFAKNRRQP
jgi:hypothetical protein